MMCTVKYVCTYIYIYVSGQIIATSHDVTLKLRPKSRNKVSFVFNGFYCWKPVSNSSLPQVYIRRSMVPGPARNRATKPFLKMLFLEFLAARKLKLDVLRK